MSLVFYQPSLILKAKLYAGKNVTDLNLRLIHPQSGFIQNYFLLLLLFCGICPKSNNQTGKIWKCIAVLKWSMNWYVISILKQIKVASRISQFQIEKKNKNKKKNPNYWRLTRSRKLEINFCSSIQTRNYLTGRKCLHRS